MDTTCYPITFYTPYSSKVFYLDINDLVVLANGGLLMKKTSPDSSTVDTLFLLNATSHPVNYPYLELASTTQDLSSARISQATINEINIAERRFELVIWGNANDGTLILGLEEE